MVIPNQRISILQPFGVNVAGLILRQCRLRRVLVAIILFSLIGLYCNLRWVLQDTTTPILGRQLSRGFFTSFQGEYSDAMLDMPSIGRAIHASASGNASLEELANEGFSACLIVMDDNHWLIEWIAYHYHVLPLRHLVLVKDPRSHTSPSHILERWRDKILIDEWVDVDFLPEWISRKYSSTNASDLWLHLNRQKFFYAQCLKSLHKRGRGWVALVDTDEFIRVNPYRHRLPSNFRQMPGHVLHFLRALRNSIDNSSCLLVPRIQVSSIEKLPLRFYQAGMPPLPDAFNASDFLTTRFVYHNQQEMEAGKNVLNLRNFRYDELPEKRTESVHRATEACPYNSPDRLHHRDSHLQIQHYLGSLEQFTYRDDPRDIVHDRETTWYTRGRNPEPTVRDIGMQSWLTGFVRSEGLEQSIALLKDVGKLEARSDGTSARQRNLPSAPLPAANFSACLIVKDDNHWLIEWLAYHYHVLPLRELIVMVDPTSQSSPQEIFQRWKGRINIETWTDESIIPTHIFKKVEMGEILPSGLHRQRQQFFYGHCLRALHLRNATWVLLSDTDEFVVPNPVADVSHKVVHSMRKPGAIRKILQMRIKSRKTKDHQFAPGCLLLPRLQMTSQLPENMSIIDDGIPRGFSGSDFLTTKWIFHNGQEIHTGHNLDGKNIINLENLNLDQIPSKVRNVHCVLPDHCPHSDGNRLTHLDTWLWMYHYLGNLEQFTFRDDPRDNILGRPKRNETLWQKTGRRGGDVILREDALAIRAWLQGFVENVGWFEARRLLKDVGQIKLTSFWSRSLFW